MRASTGSPASRMTPARISQVAAEPLSTRLIAAKPAFERWWSMLPAGTGEARLQPLARAAVVGAVDEDRPAVRRGGAAASSVRQEDLLRRQELEAPRHRIRVDADRLDPAGRAAPGPAPPAPRCSRRRAGRARRPRPCARPGRPGGRRKPSRKLGIEFLHGQGPGRLARLRLLDLVEDLQEPRRCGRPTRRGRSRTSAGT